MYGKNLVFKTGGCNSGYGDELLKYIKDGIIDTTGLIEAEFKLANIEEALERFEKGEYLKVAIIPE